MSKKRKRTGKNRRSVSRRKVLSGLATVGVAGALGGAGTMAGWTGSLNDGDPNDTTSGTNAVKTGYINPQLSGQVSENTIVALKNMAPGDTKVKEVTMTQAPISGQGDPEPITRLCFDFDYFESLEDGTTSQETDTSGANGGELDEHLNLTIRIKPSNGSESFAVTNKNINDVRNNIFEKCVTPTKPLTHLNNWTVQWYFTFVDEAGVNDAMMDQVNLGIDYGFETA